MSDKVDVMDAFKEKKWGKDEDGEHVTDGYSFRGKTIFQKALEGFKSMMKKGGIEKSTGFKFRCLIPEKLVFAWMWRLKSQKVKAGVMLC